MIDPVPEGYMRDGRGALIPIDKVKPIDMTRNDLVIEMIAKARQMNAQLAELKVASFNDVTAFVDLSLQRYGVTRGGKKGNVTLLSYDGRYKIVRQVQRLNRVLESILAAKVLVDECILKWSEGSNDALVMLVNQAFEVDRQGNFSIGRLMMLRKANIDHPEWKRAMEAVADSIEQYTTATYIRFYERVGDTEQWKPIELDFAKLGGAA